MFATRHSSIRDPIRGWSVPAELRALGKVLQGIMLGGTQVDLSALTEEMREIIQKMKDEG